MRLVTWNVQALTTNQDDIFKQLEQEKNRHLCSDLNKEKLTEIEGKHIHFYSGVYKSMCAKRGIFIAVYKKYRNDIKSWEELDKQIIMHEMKKYGESIVIGIYTPSEDMDINIKDEFYDKLTNILENSNKNKEVSLLGDFNARLGKRDKDSVIGNYGEDRLNDNR